jgi:uncharacterized membrane protein
MAQSSPPAAGGVLIALGTLAGAVIGFLLGQPTVGLLTGFAIGAIVAAAMWWRSRG